MKNLIYIVGAGSFAEKLAISLKKFPLQVVGFVDEFRTEDLMELPVTKASELVFDPSALFITAISNQDYTKNAIERLVNIGVDRSNIIPLYYDSCSVYLETTFQINFNENLAKLKSCEGQFPLYEIATRSRKLDSNLISIRLLSRGSLFLSHLRPVINALENDNSNYEIVSDRANSSLGKHKIASQEAMLTNNSKLIITSQFFNVSPSVSNKLTFLHAIYDSMMFRESIFDEIDSAMNHFIAIPSKACMTYFKNKLMSKNLRNKVTLIPFGYPKLDQNITEYKKLKHSPTQNKLVIYAPTQSLTPNSDAPEGFSLFHAYDYLLELLSIFPTHRIVLQPHPEDLILLNEGGENSASKALAQLVKLTQTHERVMLADPNLSQLELFAQSQFLISDTSSTAYTYAFTTLKPVIFLSPSEHLILKNWSHLSFIKDREKIGYICSDKTQFIENINSINQNENQKSTDIEALRTSNIYNIHTSTRNISKLIENITNGTPQDSWEPISGDLNETR